MFTPAIMPVTAGKKTANTVQKFSDCAAGTPHNSIYESSIGLPKKKDTSENAIIAKITNCALIAAFVENMERRLSRIVVTTPTTFIFKEGNIATILSENPMI